MNSESPQPDLRSTNALWASVIVETLARAGVRHAVISPGSRSTPLTIAFARHRDIHATPVLDERSAGFFAVGLAKATGLPAVLLCTSGTAAANYFPAIIEAHESAVPLLVITADRPPELRACGSGQTIDQQKLYGDYVNFFHEFAVPELDLGRLSYLRQTVVHALTRTLSPGRAVVHLNAPFRDPLPPLPDGGVAQAFGEGIDWRKFFANVDPVASAPVPRSDVFAGGGDHPAMAAGFSPEAHGVIVVGPNQPVDALGFVEQVAGVARRLGWPVVADGLAPLRNHAGRAKRLVTTYDTILRNATAAERLKPETVLCVGGWPTSKVLRSWLEASDATIWMATDRIDNRDALHGRTRWLPMTLPQLVSVLPEAGEADSGYARLWMRFEERMRAAVDERLRAEADLIEPKVAWMLARHLPAETPCFIANSMPIRDVEYVWPASDRGIRPLCNRGANGIDGTLSTALGVAVGSGRPAVMLTGDLALLHDTNGFLLAREARAGLTIVLINNRGGGIFEHLPVSQFEPPFEQFFATPQHVDFPRLCAAYEVEHVAVTNWAQFQALLSIAPSSGVRVLELQTDRKRDAAWRKRVFGELAAALE